MDPSTMKEYMAWWDTVLPSPLGMDEDEDGEMVAISKGYLDEDPHHVENPMHDPPHFSTIRKVIIFHYFLELQIDGKTDLKWEYPISYRRLLM